MMPAGLWEQARDDAVPMLNHAAGLSQGRVDGDQKVSKSVVFASLLGFSLVMGAGALAQGGGGPGVGSRGGGGSSGPSIVINPGGGGAAFGPGSGTGGGRDFGPGSGTGRGRCRVVNVRVCRGGAGDGGGPRCRVVRQQRC